MNTLVHPIAASAIPEADVIAAKAYPLIRELAHKYKLQVIARKPTSEIRSRDKFTLAREDGFPVAVAGFNREDQFSLRNIMYVKERGRNSEDRLTYCSAKLPSLMRNINKLGLIPKDTETALSRTFNVEYNVVRPAMEQYSAITKGTWLTGDDMHDVLKIVLGYQSLNNMPQESIEKYQATLDKYKKVDETRTQRLQAVKEMFDQPIKFVMHDEVGAFVKGRMKIDIELTPELAVRNARISAYEGKRVLTFMDDTDISHRMAMYKVFLQNKHNNNASFVGDEGYFPINTPDAFNSDLNILQVVPSWRGEGIGNPNWIFFL